MVWPWSKKPVDRLVPPPPPSSFVPPVPHPPTAHSTAPSFAVPVPPPPPRSFEAPSPVAQHMERLPPLPLDDVGHPQHEPAPAWHAAAPAPPAPAPPAFTQPAPLPPVPQPAWHEPAPVAPAWRESQAFEHAMAQPVVRSSSQYSQSAPVRQPPPAPLPLPPVTVAPPPRELKPASTRSFADAELESLRSSIEASIQQRSHERLAEQLPLDAQASSPFYAADGGQYRTLGDFANALFMMDETTFHHHVTPDRNDFANWIEGCFDQGVKYVGKLLRGKSRQQMAQFFTSAQPVQRPVAPQPAPVQPVVIPKPTPIPRPTFTPLPPSPLAVTPAERMQSIRDALVITERQLATDRTAARDSFIAVRTRIWQELEEEERKQVLPQLRELYEKIRSA
jgi:hypothetical protein